MNPGGGAPAGSYAFPNWALERRVSELEWDIGRMRDDIHAIRLAVEDMHRAWRYESSYAPPPPPPPPVGGSSVSGVGGQMVQDHEARLKKLEHDTKDMNGKLDILLDRLPDRGNASRPSPDNAAPADQAAAKEAAPKEAAPKEAAPKETGPAEPKKP